MNHRLHSLCPYFAMFPPNFAREHILAYTKPGDVVFDGFSGRGTTLLEALLNDRDAIACDINPVAYCVSEGKARTPKLSHVLGEIEYLESCYRRSSSQRLEDARRSLPDFFRRAYYSETLRQILFLRANLRWREIIAHTFVAALVLGHLHGERNRSENYLSNQMPHSISPKPGYSLDYWRSLHLGPPHRDVFELLQDRAEYRLEDGRPRRKGHAALCDVRESAITFNRYAGKVAAVITSPPYLDTTNFEEDQWLRLWFLGGSPRPTYGAVSRDDRHTSESRYWKFLREAWVGIKPLLARRAVIVCRIGAKDADAEVLSKKFAETLRTAWSRVSCMSRPKYTLIPSSQAKLLAPNSIGCRFELDLCYMVGGG